MTAEPAAQPERSLGKKLLRRGIVAVLLIALMLVPGLGLMALTGQPAATYAALATIISVSAILGGGLRIGLITAIVVPLLAPLAVIAGLTPITGAALMVIMTLTVGRLATFGLHRATMLVPVMLAWPMLSPVPWLPHDAIDKVNALLAKHGTSLADALTAALGSGSPAAPGGGATGDATAHMITELRMNQTYLTWLVAFFFIGAIVPVVIGFLLRHRLPAPKLTEHPRSETVPYAIAITALTGVATFYFLSNPSLPGGAFMIAVILVLTQVGNDIAWRLTLERVIGTFVGVAIFMGVNAMVGSTTFVEVFGLPFPGKIYAIGIAFSVAAIMAKFSPRHWIYYILIVPTTAYLNAFTVGEAAGLGKARLIDNAVGSALVIVAALVTLGASHLHARRHPASSPEQVKASPA